MRENKVVIFGAGGHGKVVMDILLERGARVAGFLDEDCRRIGQRVCGLKVLGDWSYLEDNSSIAVALGIGNNKMRHHVYEKAKNLGLKVVCALHPKASISRSATIAEGVVVMAGAVINPCAQLAQGVVVNTAASVDHDCVLERFCQIWPGAHLAGAVRVGEFSYVGTGASVIQGLTIGSNSLIGSGAAVIEDIAQGIIAVGVPAKKLKRNDR